MAQLLKCGATTARLITINDSEPDEKGRKVCYNLRPGGADAEPVAVPDRLVQTAFVQALIKSGDITNLGAGEPDAPTEVEALDALRLQCDTLGIKYDKRWKDARLQAEIDNVTDGTDEGGGEE